MTRNMGFDVVVVGSANTDFLIRGPKLTARDRVQHLLLDLKVDGDAAGVVEMEHMVV